MRRGRNRQCHARGQDTRTCKLRTHRHTPLYIPGCNWNADCLLFPQMDAYTHAPREARICRIEHACKCMPTQVDPVKKTYAISSEMSIEFEVDGPYKVRLCARTFIRYKIVNGLLLSPVRSMIGCCCLLSTLYLKRSHNCQRQPWHLPWLAPRP